MGIDDRADYRQAEARTSAAGAPDERLEQPAHLLGVDVVTGVGDPEERAAGGDRDVAARMVVADSVVHEVADHAAEQHGFAGDRRGPQLRPPLDVTVDLSYEVREIDRPL